GPGNPSAGIREPHPGRAQPPVVLAPGSRARPFPPATPSRRVVIPVWTTCSATLRIKYPRSSLTRLKPRKGRNRDRRTPRAAPPRRRRAAPVPGDHGIRARGRGPRPGMRPVEDQQDRDWPARHQAQGAPRAAHRVRRARARAGRADGHRQPGRPARLVDYVIMESAAAEIMTYEAQVVPALLRTDDYARAIAAAEPRYTTNGQRDE